MINTCRVRERFPARLSEEGFPTIGIGAWLFHEDDAARRIFIEQSHGMQWLQDDRNDGEAPILDADKDELCSMGDEDEVPLAHQWRVGCY